MGKKPKIEDSTRRAATGTVTPKRKLSRWESEKRRRRILVLFISLVIAGIVIAGGVVAYVHFVKNNPWNQSIVKVNSKVYDMGYFVKMLRMQQLYGYSWGEDYSQDIEYAGYVADMIRDNELKRQEAEEEYGIDITDDEIDEELKSQVGYDPESEDEDEFYQRIEDILEGRGISMADFKQLFIEPIVLQKKLLEAFGDTEYPEGSLYNHVQVRAILLGTEEEALEVRDKWDGDFNQILKDYSSTRYYPDSGYWLVMVTDNVGEDEGDDLYVRAILLATEEKADEVAAEFDGSNFAGLAELYSLDSSGEDGGDMGWMSLDEVESKFGNLDAIQALELNTVSDPIPENYPDEAVEWLPEGIESSIFDGYAFDEGSVGTGVSEPISDTAYYTKGGYWLVMVYEPEDAEEYDGLYIKAILLDSEGEAEDIADEFDGDNFADLAEEYSLHSSSDNGGDMGLMSLEDIDSQFGTGVLADINDLSPDEISTPIETADGYWLVIVAEGDGEGEEGEQYINAILLATEDQAEEVAAEFDGSNFADLAELYSLDISGEDGGDMGWMSQEDIESKFGAGVLAIITDLSQDEISTPIYDESIRKQSGYWLIEVRASEDRTLIEYHRALWISEAYNDWLEEERNSEENNIVNYVHYLNDDNGYDYDYEKIFWALERI